MVEAADVNHPEEGRGVAGRSRDWVGRWGAEAVDAQTLRQWDRTTLWHAFSQMADYDGLLIERGEGNYLIDADGNRYLDGVASMWCNVHGHARPEINAAVAAQLEKIAHVSLLGLAHPLAVTLARRLCDIAPPGLEHVFYASDGAAAVEAAMKMAFQYWRQRRGGPQQGRNLFIAAGGAYHGDTIGAVSVGGVSRFRAMFHPLLFPVLQGPMPHCVDPGRDAPELCGRLLGQYERLLAEHAGEVAAVIVEPLVQAAAGIVLHPKGFLKGLRELADRHDTLLIADEVAVGFGKTGRMFACEHEGVTPDFLCLGKGLGAGYLPISAALTTPRVFEAFLGDYAESRSFFHGHTFGGNPLAAAAAHASLDLFELDGTLVHVAAAGEHLRRRLEELAGHPHLANPRGIGLIAAVDLVRDKRSGAGYAWEERRGARLCREALRHGVWLRPLGNTIVVMPPLSIEIGQIDTIADAIARSVDTAVG